MKQSLFLFAAAGMLAFASCTKNESPSTQGDAKVQLVLTDAPAEYDAVYVNIKEVKINVGNPETDGVPDGSSGGQWVNYPLSTDLDHRINLLDLRNGDFMYMGEPMSLPAGKITQIRMILEETGNAVVVKGVEQPLTTPSAQQSGLKINFHQTLAPDGIYKIWLDFDAGRSVVKAGNSGKYLLKPVIKAKLESADFGAIRGIVLPADAKTTVYLLQGADTVATAIPETGLPLGIGFYKFPQVNAGTYNVSLNAVDSTNYIDSTITGVVVTAGQIKDLGTSTLHK